MVVGMGGVPGVFALKQSVAYRLGLENVPIQNQHMAGNIVMGAEHLWGSVTKFPAAMKVTYTW